MARITSTPVYRVDPCDRHLADIILRRHPDLRQVLPGDCATEEEYRRMKRIVAEADNDGCEAHRWCPRPRPRTSPPDSEALWDEMRRIRRDGIDGIPSAYERVRKRIRERLGTEAPQ
jgi:hypothetical protein